MLLDLNALASSRRALFIGGKGGVGKTSTASAVAWDQARQGRKVLVVSTDPAHNLGHLWERQVGDSPVPLWRPSVTGTAGDAGAAGAASNEGLLDGVEIDPDATSQRHLAQVTATLKDLMPPHLHKQVEQHVQLSAHSPGTHESATLERMADLVTHNGHDYDLMIFDTAPSGHTARLLALPEIMTTWTEGLLQRRSKAEKFGAAVRAFDDNDDPDSSVGAGRDRRIRQVLTQRKIKFEGLRRLVTDSRQCSFVIVLAPERLPVLESVELYRQLTSLGVDVAGLVVNRLSPTDQGDFLAQRRVAEDRCVQDLRASLPQVPIQGAPLLPYPPTGESGVQMLAELLASAEPI